LAGTFTLDQHTPLRRGEVHELNRQWRDKDKPTNVELSMLEADELDALANTDDAALLGDMILAYGVCATEVEDKSIRWRVTRAI
jgi:probable rRNA maturation factor